MHSTPDHPEQLHAPDFPARLICTFGHEVPVRALDTPQYFQNWCPLCGADAMDDCDECDTLVPLEDPDGRLIPAYCRGCGYPYIWTGEMMGAAEDCIQEMERLAPAERAQLAKRVADVVRNDPAADVAARIVRVLLDKAGVEAEQELRDVVYTLLPRTTREVVWGRKGGMRRGR